MIKTAMLLIFLSVISSTASAFDGEVYFGHYFNSNKTVSPHCGQFSFNRDEAQFVSGIMLGHDIGKFFRLYTEVEALIDGVDEESFNPGSCIFVVGGRATYGRMYIDLRHSCWHPFENSGWFTEEYNLIKCGVKF